MKLCHFELYPQRYVLVMDSSDTFLCAHVLTNAVVTSQAIDFCVHLQIEIQTEVHVE